jgi:outer membrane immunogenic protein
VRNPWILATASTVALVGANEAHAATPYSWTGFYVGVNAGGANHQATTQDLNGWAANGLNNPPYVTPWFKSSKTGGTFGAQAGYNWQMNSFVFGFEADASHVGISQSIVPANTLAAACGNCGVLATNEITWLTTMRGRLGFAFDRVLFYGTAGAAAGYVNNHWGFGFIPFSDRQFNVSGAQVGYVVGGGIEAMITTNVLLRAEYLHVDLGTSHQTIVWGGPGSLVHDRVQEHGGHRQGGAQLPLVNPSMVKRARAVSPQDCSA